MLRLLGVRAARPLRWRDSEARRVLMSAGLSKDLFEKHNVRSLPVRKGDEVMVTRGAYKNREGKVETCYRRKFVIHIERITREKANGNTVHVAVHPSKVHTQPKSKWNERTDRTVPRYGRARTARAAEASPPAPADGRSRSVNRYGVVVVT
eukprot:TRINITY_DN1831_c0_g1_i1.p1 TRINITY_DN1831_c0_g1~~TRINITY_DN1831_c0_g1_i1.p1  ORF type:complete len:151 (-),score=37.40 TRINITY_DN1831_c0_g1_i1:28-480(-)